jgi:hypothetical protein
MLHRLCLASFLIKTYWRLVIFALTNNDKASSPVYGTGNKGVLQAFLILVAPVGVVCVTSLTIAAVSLFPDEFKPEWHA